MAALTLVTACGTDPVEETTDGVTKDDEDDSQDDDSTPSKVKDSGKPSGGKSDAGAGKTDAASGSGGKTNTDAGAVAATGSIPCAVDKIVEENCRLCHGAKPAFTATFSLTTLAHFQGAADTDDTKKMHEVALTRVSATDKKRMPPTQNDALSAADLKTLTDWLKGGAKAGEACAAGDSVKPPAPGDDTEVPLAGPGGGAHATKLRYDDPDLKCYPLTAFTQGDRTKPYSVPTTPDLYVAFNMKAPWTGKQYVRSFRSIIDNTDVLHHWLLFKQSTGGSDSVQPNALGAHPDGIMLYGWAPGGDDLYLDSDVAMEVDSSVLYQLELHYNNKTGSPKPDASGVELCVTPNKPEHVAGLSWVGTDAIAGTSATGRCAHTSQAPIHLIVAQPHMHTKGKHMKVTLARKGGMMETIHDQPFDFNNQRSYIFDKMVINPGDVMNTTCTFSSPATFGKATSDEMCYFFSIHWPAGALSSFGVGTIIHGANSCMDI